MDKILIHWDRVGNTLNVWFDDPKKEHVCEETGDEVILVKDSSGAVIGFEKLNYAASEDSKSRRELPVEVQIA